MTRARCLLAVALLLAPATVSAQAHQELTWLDMDFPPFFIHDGEQKGQGIADEVTSLLEREMEGWRHREEVATTAQILVRLKAGGQVCSAAYIRTPEREQAMVFSTPDLLLPPNGITVRRADLAKFGGGGAVSLAALLENPSLRLGIAQGRSYGEPIDAILQRHKQDKHVYSRFGEDIYAGLLDLLQRGTVDYIIGYPYEAAYHARTKDIEDLVASLPVRENPELTRAHVVCPKTDWGRSTIAAIDPILEKARKTAEYRAFVERWLGPELRAAYREAYEAEFGLPASR